MGRVRDVLASYKRAAELDGAFLGGGPQRSLGSLIAQAHFVVGRNLADCVEPFERAIEIDSCYLENLVNYVESYAIPIGNTVLASRLLERIARVIENPEAVTAWPLYNHVVLARVEALDGLEIPLGLLQVGSCREAAVMSPSCFPVKRSSASGGSGAAVL